MTATDGHCLAQVRSEKYKLEEPKKWLLPRRAIFELRKLIDVLPEQSEIFLGMCGNQLVFSSGTFNFFTKLLLFFIIFLIRITKINIKIHFRRFYLSLSMRLLTQLIILINRRISFDLPLYAFMRYQTIVCGA